jgi:hypothetical protein
LEWQNAHYNNKHAFVNNRLFRVKWGFGFRAKGTLNEWGKNDENFE